MQTKAEAATEEDETESEITINGDLSKAKVGNTIPIGNGKKIEISEITNNSNKITIKTKDGNTYEFTKKEDNKWTGQQTTET